MCLTRCRCCLCACMLHMIRVTAQMHTYSHILTHFGGTNTCMFLCVFERVCVCYFCLSEERAREVYDSIFVLFSDERQYTPVKWQSPHLTHTHTRSNLPAQQHEQHSRIHQTAAWLVHMHLPFARSLTRLTLIFHETASERGKVVRASLFVAEFDYACVQLRTSGRCMSE